MSSGKNNPKVFQIRNPLYVVRERVSERQYVLCTPENITPGRKVFAEKIRAMSGVEGAIVGAFIGERPWDVQPVMLVKGKMTLLRVSDPGISLKSAAFEDLKNYYERLAKHVKPESLIDWGVQGDQIWIHRHYYNRVLSWSEAVGPDGYARENVLGVHPLSILKAVIAAVFELHKAGLNHGHLSRSNMTLVEGRPVLFDHGLRLHGFVMGEPDEIGAFDRFTTDVFWLAQLIDFLVGRELSQEHKEFLSVMQSPGFSERPDLVEVIKVFAPELLRSQGPSRSEPGGFTNTSTESGFEPSESNVIKRPSAGSERRGKILDPGIKIMDAVPKETIATKKQNRPVRLENIVEAAEPVVRRVSVASQIPPAPEVPPIALEGQGAAGSVVRSGEGSVVPQPSQMSGQIQKKKVAAASSLKKDLHPVPADQKKSAKVSGSDREATSSSSGTIFIIIVLCVFGTGLLYKLGYLPEQIDQLFSKRSDREPVQYEDDWLSGQQARMRTVARAAVIEGDRAAITAIVKAIKHGAGGSFINSEILQVGLSDLWFDQLSLADKRLLLAYSLGKLVSAPPDDLINVVEAHRAVALALVVGLPLSVEQRWFGRIKLQEFSVLPAPFGRAFSLLSDLGVLTLEGRSARALAAILVGRYDKDVLSDYFNRSDPLHISVGKLRVLEPLFDSMQGLAEALLESLAFRVAVLTRTAGWFAQEEIAGWGKVSTAEKLRLMAAMPTRGVLSVEQLADLLRYPLSTGQQLAVSQLKKRLRRRVSQEVVEFLATDACKFTRTQTVSLVIALSSRGDGAFTLLDRWFHTGPDASSVLRVLLLRKTEQRVDAFNIEAARYLKGQELALDLSQKKELVQHTEILVRSLGYSALSPGQPEELRLLRDMSRVEPSERLRRQLTTKLSIARERLELGD